MMPSINIEKCPSVGLSGTEIPSWSMLPSESKKGMGTNRPNRYTVIKIIVTRSGLRNPDLVLKLEMLFSPFQIATSLAHYFWKILLSTAASLGFFIYAAEPFRDDMQANPIRWPVNFRKDFPGFSCRAMAPCPLVVLTKTDLSRHSSNEDGSLTKQRLALPRRSLFGEDGSAPRSYAKASKGIPI